MNIKSLPMKKTLRAALLVLLLSLAGMTNILAQTQGALNGVFTINNSGDKVRFSQGNLQYQASTNTWRFATNQQDYVGTDNENISATYSGWIDLFGWGTSGYHNSYDNFNVNYQPWAFTKVTVNTECNLYGYGPSTNMSDQNLTGTSAEYDWGIHNAISNGGNQVGLWRTLTKDEWNYIFKTREASTVGGTANARFLMAKVNGVSGVILFPDYYSHPSFLPNPSNVNNASASCSLNSFSDDGWTAMEYLGCVFLPAAGCRYGTSTRYHGYNGTYYGYDGGSTYPDKYNANPTPGGYGLYWSASYLNEYRSYHVGFKTGHLYYCDYASIPDFLLYTKNTYENKYAPSYGRYGGYSVRLVCDVQTTAYSIGVSSNPSDGGVVTGAGSYAEGTLCVITATANNGYTFTNWTENGVMVSNSTSYSFTVMSSRNLVANFEATPETHTISVSASPMEGGIVIGGGTYNNGITATLYAIANTGYIFTNWTENGTTVSTNAIYNFTVSGDRNLVANFTDSFQNHTISVSVNPSNGGTVTGAGTYNNGETATLCAISNTGYTFTNWTENGSVVSSNANYSFTVTSSRNLVANFSLNSYNVSASANPITGGTIIGDGTYAHGSTCSLTATPNYGYTFINWMENGIIVSINNTYSFTVTSSKSFVANFASNTNGYSISVTANPPEGGLVTGSGTYNASETCTLTAIANEGYAFINWTENGNTISTNSTFSFVVSCDRNIVANFLYIGTGEMRNGMFSVSNNTRVCFSQGNLQYQASTNTWRFADHQWDWVGGTVQGVHYGNVSSSSNNNISSTYDGWIDLFGWGTSGWDNGNTCYHPWDINSDNNGTLFGPPSLNSLVGEYANADWGVYNPISNGGNQANQWRTLTYWEWHYLLDTRTTFSGVRYAKAQVNGVNGLILLPDNWDTSIYELQNVNSSTASFDSNVISLYLWENTFESNGTVFLPAAGLRFSGTSLFYLNSQGTYWFSTCHGSYIDHACQVWFSNNGLSTSAGNRSTGLSVRLVRDVITQTVNLSPGWNWFSTNVEITLDDLKAALVEALPGTKIAIKSQKDGATTYNGRRWKGQLSSLDVAQMYMIGVSAACEITLEGLPINPAEHPITINKGWNWIGFPCSQSVSVNVAMSGFNPKNNDVIKGIHSYAVYKNGRWRGTLNTLEPGQGYMYGSGSNTPKTLVFQTGRSETTEANITPENNYYRPTADYADNMTLTAVVELDGVELRSNDYEVAAFVGDECRGSVKLMYVEPIDRYVAFLTVFGGQEEDLHFRLTDGVASSLSTDRLAYATDGILGTLGNPVVVLHFGPMDVEENASSDVKIYPNPSESIFNIEGQNIRKVEVFNALGQPVYSKDAENDLMMIDLTNRAAGIYLIRIVTDNGIWSHQVMKR